MACQPATGRLTGDLQQHWPPLSGQKLGLAILDHCPNDLAVWLDEGDLSKVVRVCRTEALVTGAMDDVDGDGVADALEGPEDGAAPAGRDGARLSKEEAPWACPNCGGAFSSGPKCPECNVVGYRR